MARYSSRAIQMSEIVRKINTVNDIWTLGSTRSHCIVPSIYHDVWKKNILCTCSICFYACVLCIWQTARSDDQGFRLTRFGYVRARCTWTVPLWWQSILLERLHWWKSAWSAWQPVHRPKFENTTLKTRKHIHVPLMSGTELVPNTAKQTGLAWKQE